MRRPDKIRRKGGIVWQARYRDELGVTRYETFRTQKEAEARLRAIESQRADGSLVTAKMTFDELATEWCNAHLTDGLRTNSIRDYREAVERLTHHFTGKLLRAITPASIEDFRQAELVSIRAGLQARGRAGATTGGIRSVNKAVMTLGAMLKFAQGRRYITFNAAEHVKKLKPATQHDAPLDANVLSPAELGTLFGKDANGHPHVHPDWRAALMVLAYGGLRIGEMLGSQWGDIEFVSNRIRVQRQLEVASGQLRPPKTRAAVRLVEVPAFVMHELKVWKLRCPQGSLGLCFPTKTGNPYSADNFRARIFRPALRRAGLRQVRVHDLRHGAASMLIATGADLATISRQLGHASIAITLATYAHQFARRNETGLGAKLEALVAQEAAGCELAANSGIAR